MCVGIMYSGEYDVCHVTLSVRASSKVCLTTVGIKPATFVIQVAMLYQLSYGVKSVRVGDISELSLVSSISMYSKI